jgi:hypothetical protein
MNTAMIILKKLVEEVKRQFGMNMDQSIIQRLEDKAVVQDGKMNTTKMMIVVEEVNQAGVDLAAVPAVTGQANVDLQLWIQKKGEELQLKVDVHHMAEDEEEVTEEVAVVAEEVEEGRKVAIDLLFQGS